MIFPLNLDYAAKCSPLDRGVLISLSTTEGQEISDRNIRIDYASMQASGMVMDHTQDCDRYAQLVG